MNAAMNYLVQVTILKLIYDTFSMLSMIIKKGMSTAS